MKRSLEETQVTKIRNLYIGGMSKKKIAKKFNTTVDIVNALLNRSNYKKVI